MQQSSAATPNGRCRPSAFGIKTRLDGFGRYAARCTRLCRSTSRPFSADSYTCHVTPSTPGEALLSFLCYLPHTVQPLGHAFPTQCRVHVRLNDVLSRLCPSLSNLRSRSPSPVRLVQETSHDVPCKTRGQDGFATSFPVGSCIPYNMPVYPGAQSAAYSRNFKQFGQGHIS